LKNFARPFQIKAVSDHDAGANASRAGFSCCETTVNSLPSRQRDAALGSSVVSRIAGISEDAVQCLLQKASMVLSNALGHSPAQAQGPHVGPCLFDILQTIGFGAARPDCAPPVGNFLVVGPNGILFFVIHHDEVNRFVGLAPIRHISILFFELAAGGCLD
jgi:hypothetical protein